ncbi:flagellar biosynthesis protein FlhF [Salisediminibacterium halotolerans]|uniref:Flagellar biosynthesis protein FlhF n=1 Tax=Salisediminibacterium halotolerans TaxID=517425 RepID=A0A1H9Q6U4_9BACI|nr:flagellar biosynthesis protein FlhF [Salisediminibacterium haloalkalitolerans]SER55835.1 flagellar biosynthesis protein FlhF [Salisediminibacterium haloalkalitolerans]
MKIKKVHARDMTDAMAKIKDELGKDAVILNSKNIEKGGIFGFFKKKNIEVIAALDDDRSSPKPASERRPVRTPAVSPPGGKNNSAGTHEQTAGANDRSALASEIEELKRLVLTQQTGSQNAGIYPEPLDALDSFLADQEIKSEHRMELMKELLRKWYRTDEHAPGYEEAFSWMKEALYHRLADADFSQLDYSHKYVNIVGPTGAGKTTTAAKIGAEAALNDGKSVAFITTDTFRIAAIEQLKTYAKILNAPLEVAYSIDDFREAVKKFSTYDLVIIDSAGRNFRNSQYVQQLKELIDFNEDIETHLVLAVTSKYRDMKTIIEQFQLIAIHKLIFTKVDETDSCGAMYNAVLDYRIGISYISNGQNVPDDISGTSATDLAERLMRR